MPNDLDASKQEKSDSDLVKSELRFRTIFESSRDAIMTLEPPEWKFTSGNPATIKMFLAKDEADFVSRGPAELSPELQPDGQPSAAKAKEMIEIALRDGSNFFEWTHRRLNGEDFPATILLTKVELPGRVFCQATVRDITEQKNAEAAMREKMEKIEKMNEIMVGREMKIVTLKQENEELKEQLKECQQNF